MGDAPDRIRLPKTTAEAWAVETDPALMANGETDWPLYVRADLAPTDAEVEAAARVLVSATACDPDKIVTLVQVKPGGGSVILEKGPFWKEKAALARAVLLAGRKGGE